MTVTVTTSSNQNNRDNLNPPQLRLEFEFNLDSRKKRTAILLNELPKTAEIRNGNKLLVSYPMDLRNRRSNAWGGVRFECSTETYPSTTPGRTCIRIWRRSAATF